MLGDTENFGLTRVGQGETLAKNGYAALTTDRTFLDRVMQAMLTHSHDGGDRLTSPDQAPALTTEQGDPDAMLPGGRTYYYRYSFIDRFGLETSGSPEAAIATPPGTSAPQAPDLDHHTSGGELNAGTYSYRITYSDLQGGETTPSNAASITIYSDQCNGQCRIELTFEEGPAIAHCVNIYRSKQGQSRFYLLAKVENGTTYFDDGTVTEDTTRTPPRSNTTGGQNKVEVVVPEIPEGVTAWRLYRTQIPGNYSNSSLVHHVVETEEQSSGDLVDTWVDLGGSLSAGKPRSRSSTLPGAPTLRLDQLEGFIEVGNLPRGARSWDLFLPGDLEVRTYGKIVAESAIDPASLSAYFLTPVDGIGTAWIRFILEDELGNIVDLVVDEDGDFYRNRLPRTDQGYFEAHLGERSTQVAIVNDPDASEGQAAQVMVENSFVRVDLGALDAATYRAWVNIRLAEDSDPLPDDVRLRAIRASDHSPISTRVLTITNDTYEEIAFEDFTVQQGEEVLLQMEKIEEGQVVFYNVDYFRYEADLESLELGEITMRVDIGGFVQTLAEDGNLSGTAAVVVDEDAESGNAVHLPNQNDRVDILLEDVPNEEMGARVQIRTDGGAAPVDGIRLTAHRADTMGVLSSTDVTPDSANYEWFDFANFTPPIDVDVYLRIEKIVDDPEPYYVSHIGTDVEGFHPGSDVQFRVDY